LTRAESGGLSALRHETGRGLAVTDCLGVTCVLVSGLWLSQPPHPVSMRTMREPSEWVAALLGAAVPAKMPVARMAAAAMRAARFIMLIG
jgi:hypothetical protein